MAGDWIKMRVWLRKDPRVASMADFLATQRDFIGWLTDPVRQSCKVSAYEHITSDVTRAITVSALLEIWGVARERGNRAGDDLVLKHCTLVHLDDICGTPMIGEAMDFVQWAVQEDGEDHKGRKYQAVRFPNFFRDNESPDDRYRKQHAEAQARYRSKVTSQDDHAVMSRGDVTVTPREEKRREEVTSSAKARIELSAEGWFGVSDEDLSAWRRAYPAIDLQTELNRAAAWANANPKNRKSNWRRFMVNWLSRAQDKAPRVVVPIGGPSRRVAL